MVDVARRMTAGERASASRPTDPPGRIAVVGRLVGSPRAWSGVPSGLCRGLAEFGFQGVEVGAQSGARGERLLRYWQRLSRRDGSWSDQEREAMFLRERGVARRIRSLDLIAGVQMGSEFGHPLQHPFVTLEDMTVAQALQISEYAESPMPSRIADHWMQRQAAIYRRATACCVASHWAADSVITDYGVPAEKVHVVGFGRNLEIEVPDRTWDTPRFLWFGLDWTRKNGNSVLAAFRALREQQGDATLDLIGDHPRVDLPGVTGHGPLDYRRTEDLAVQRALYARATCFVMPSLYEPFGIAHCEAGWAGLPSIGTRSGGAADAIGAGGGLLVDPHNVSELIEAMKLLSQPVRAKAAGAMARRQAELLSWRHVAGRVLQALGLVSGEIGDLPSGASDRRRRQVIDRQNSET